MLDKTEQFNKPPNVIKLTIFLPIKLPKHKENILIKKELKTTYKYILYKICAS